MENLVLCGILKSPLLALTSQQGCAWQEHWGSPTKAGQLPLPHPLVLPFRASLPF